MSYIDDEIKRYELSDEEFEKNADKIFNILSMNASKVDNPKLVIVGGQAGSGKTGLVCKKNEELGGAIIIDQDEIRASFPEELYEQILKDHDDREEYLILKPYVLKMRQELVDRARRQGYNVIMESAMQAVDSFIPQIQSFKAVGYETELAVMAVPEIDCFLSTLNRYCYYLEKDGICRRNTKMDPQMMIKLKNNLVKFENTGLFDNIEVDIRGKNATDKPERIYLRSEEPYTSALEAFNRGIMLSQAKTRNTFPERANSIRSTLSKYNQEEQLQMLDELETRFKEFEEEGRE